MSSSKKPQRKPSRARGPAPRARAASARPAAKAANRTPPKGRKPVKVAPKAASKTAAKAAQKTPPKPKVASAPEPLPPPPPPPRPSIRLSGSASSRLTIKPSPPQGPRPQLQLSTKPRPSGPMRLSGVELDEDEVLIDGFDAVLEGERVRITAVLERTCVYVDRNGDRRLARKEELWVEANKLPIRRRGLV